MFTFKNRIKCHIHQGSLIISILIRINPIPRIGIYFCHLILSSQLYVGLPRHLFPASLRAEIIKALLPSILATYPAHLYLLDWITLAILDEWYKLRISVLWSFPYSQLLLGLYIRLSTMFSNTFNLRSSNNTEEHVSHPYCTTGNIIVLYNLILYRNIHSSNMSFWYPGSLTNSHSISS